METLGHSDRAIDIFKIDIEGSEFAALIPVLESGKFPKVNQVCAARVRARVSECVCVCVCV